MAAPGLFRAVGGRRRLRLGPEAGNGGVSDPAQPASSWSAPGLVRAGPAARGRPGRHVTSRHVTNLREAEPAAVVSPASCDASLAVR
jgi:hypothetical protein